jgi:two-component system, chemotaxis family, CheB/CheR fusion protein
MPTATVYVVSADPSMRACLVELLRSASLRSKAFTDLQACLDHVGPDRIGTLLFDMPANDSGGSEPSQLAVACARMPTLVIVDRGDVPQAVSALRAGGLVILERPVTRADLLAGIRRATSDQG